MKKIIATLLAPLSLICLPAMGFAQTALPDYSRLSASDLQSLATRGDMHAVFTQGYNLIFDANQNLRPNADLETARRLLETAHANGHETANSLLVLFYEGEFGQAPDFAKVEPLLTTAAERGSAAAQLNYAYRFIDADDPAKSDRAMRYVVSATQNAEYRETAYPLLIEVLYGVNFDKKQNLPLARKKSEECVNLWPENTFCHYILGRDFEQGWGGAQNAARSDFHLKKAANLGDARAQWTVGMRYLNGVQVQKNEQTAYSWVKKSADQNYIDGLISLAVMTALGQGTQANPAAAFKIYETATTLGSPHALRGLGSMYCTGEAPKTDRNLCAAALILAYQGGDDPAGDLLTRFFDVTDQAGFDALEKAMAPAMTSLMDRYNIQFNEE